jgi:molybdopterin-containing oxidoreductase family iron-sulfur binding subunit
MDDDVDLLSRRELLTLMGASLAFGASACVDSPKETIHPYVRAPESLLPGNALHYATAHLQYGLARGIIVKTVSGRPIKIDGNPDHPASLGAADIFAQASILELYDPERARSITERGTIRTTSTLDTAMSRAIAAQREKKGAGLRILTGAITSPSLAAEFENIQRELPEYRRHVWESCAPHQTRAGHRLAYGVEGQTIYRPEKAKVIVTFNADLAGDFPGGLRYAREISAKRKPDISKEEMNRIYAVESTPTLIGALADHRLAASPMRIEALLVSLADRLKVPGAPARDLDAREARFIEAVARDLAKSRGSSLVVAGESVSPELHAVVHLINETLGNTGTTVLHLDPVDSWPNDQVSSLRELASELDAGTVDVLLILGGNPAYDAPADLSFAEKIQKAKLSFRSGRYFDETSDRCTWHIPETHTLEAWGDARAYDGTISLIQPVLAPLYGGRSSAELLASFFGRRERTGHQLVRSHYRREKDELALDRFWKETLHQGFVSGSAFEPHTRTLKSGLFENIRQPERRPIELQLAPDPTIGDGECANNAWLQELPKPFTKLTWENAALISPAFAERENLRTGDIVELGARSRTVEAPVLIAAGQAENTITLHFGYGRQSGGKVGLGKGFAAGNLRFSGYLSGGSDVLLVKTKKRTDLAITQLHHSMEGRDIARKQPVSTLAEAPVHKTGHARLSLYPERVEGNYAWGMSIDLSSCIGCNACIIACQSENNISVVGKTEVINNREMHWIRVDNYFEEEEIFSQPVPCMHCEKAPCEPVCPVAATSHSDEGLNEMTYNRCVGTRYCANNCPYRVRRFNYYQYSDQRTESLKSMRNPSVTVRSRGVMEKCTYCVQRINAARITSEVEGRTIRDREIVTACESVCPTQAITFGDSRDPNTRVSALKKLPRSYALLEELGTEPRTTYLARIKNPNPDLENT